jgi:thiamine pyrophosphokinase
MIDEMRLWSKQRGNRIFHLGGGLGSRQDSLFDFKASFSKQRHPFYTLRLITDSQNYRNLIKARAMEMNINPEELIQTSYFPAYRASAV